MSKLFCFGFGYTASYLARHLQAEGWDVRGTATSKAGAERLNRDGFAGLVFDGASAGAGIEADLLRESHVLVSVPPGPDGDPVLRHHACDLANTPAIRWIGYLSTIGVYGDRQGAWVDETTPVQPGSVRSQRRVDAENAWLDFSGRTGKTVQIFRLAGIYGPDRSAIDNLRAGTARRIVKPGQVFNRIHVADIVRVLAAAIQSPGGPSIYNVTDDEPAPPQDVITYAAELLGIAPPPEIAIDDAQLTAMAASFYEENKRVRNDRIKTGLGITLAYPSYRDGLRALAKV